MTVRERDILYKINAAMVKLSTPPLTTNSPLTGEVYTPPPLAPATQPLPLSIPTQSPSGNAAAR